MNKNSHSMTMTAHLNSYLEYLICERNLCETTVKLRKCLLRPFLVWLGSRSLTQLTVKGYIHYLQKQGSRPESINVFIQSVFGFTHYLGDVTSVDYTAIKKIKRLVIKPSLPEYLTREEMALLIHAPSDNHFRNRQVWDCLFLLLALTGMRISEATALTWKHIVKSESGYWIHIRQGKTGDRTIILPKGCERILTLRKRCDLIFTNRFCKRVSVNAANEELRRRALRVGIEKPVHCHLFRHGALTYYASKGKTTHELAALSGHVKSSTLDKYVHLSGHDTMWVEGESL